MITLVQSCSLADGLDYPDECGVVGLVNLAMADLRADVSAWLCMLWQQQLAGQESERLYPTTVRGDEEVGPGWQPRRALHELVAKRQLFWGGA